jgi:hypothetical protein
MIVNKVAIEHNLIVPSSFSALITQVLPINGNSCLLPNRDLKDNFDSDMETLTEGGK